jgi:hypothetical protein
MMWLTPQENFDRKVDIECPTHLVTILPAAVCPFCKWPEVEI